MTQFPHDEFDDVPPYKADEVGKHRAPGAVASAGTAGGGLKWIGLLAALVLVIGAVAWITSQFGGDDEAPTADPDDEQTAEDNDTEEADGEAEENGEGNGNGEENGDSDEEEAQEDDDAAEDEVNMDYSLIVYNFDGTEGVAGSVRDQLDGAGFNVVDQDNWNQGWTTCEEAAPVVVHPPAEEELAQMIADEIGAATCASEGWSASETIAIAVGAESLP